MHEVFQGIINSPEYDHELCSQYCTRISQNGYLDVLVKLNMVKYWLFSTNNAIDSPELIFHEEDNAVINLSMAWFYFCLGIFRTGLIHSQN